MRVLFGTLQSLHFSNNAKNCYRRTPQGYSNWMKDDDITWISWTSAFYPTSYPCPHFVHTGGTRSPSIWTSSVDVSSKIFPSFSSIGQILRAVYPFEDFKARAPTTTLGGKSKKSGSEQLCGWCLMLSFNKVSGELDKNCGMWIDLKRRASTAPLREIEKSGSSDCADDV